jgi:hypothetical protein
VVDGHGPDGHHLAADPQPERASSKRILDNEELLQRDGARITIDGVIYCVTTVEYDGEGLYTLTLEDEVSWRLSRFSTYRVADRAHDPVRLHLRLRARGEPQAVPPMRSFIPEVDDKQPIAQAEAYLMALKRKQAPAKGKKGASNRGTGSERYR